MRTIKFRGKDLDTGEWIYGHFFQRLGHYPTIVEPRPRDGKVMYYEIAVEDTTVGQFTGLLDTNGKEIWEGDVVRVGILSPNYTGSYPEPYYVDTACIYKEGAFLYKRISPFDKKKLSRNWTYKPMHRYEIYSTEVIGNIHDNPELLKGGIK